MESLYRCLRLQVCSLALSGINSHGACGAYHFACLLACLILTEVWTLMLFRSLSYAEIGSAAMMSWATAGVARGTVIVSMPGSSAAVRLAMDKLILPELAHMSHIARG